MRIVLLVSGSGHVYSGARNEGLVGLEGVDEPQAVALAVLVLLPQLVQLSAGSTRATVSLGKSEVESGR